MITVHNFTDLASASLKAAEIITSRALECVRNKGYFSLVLAGGSTPKLLYQTLSSPPFSTELPWQHIYFFWGDERMVCHDHPDSNAAMVFQNLLNSSAVLPDNIFPVPTENNKAGHNARLYEKTIIEFFKRKSQTPATLSFDCVLLGMGTDGHTASLFPGSPVLDEKKHFTAAVAAPSMSPSVDRVTMTLPLINRAATILFLIDGNQKGAIADEILSNPVKAQRFPAALVQPAGELIWCISRPTESS
jgi:6-phosphogluconolactonase